MAVIDARDRFLSPDERDEIREQNGFDYAALFEQIAIKPIVETQLAEANKDGNSDSRES